MNGTIFNIQKFCVSDGPGIRTVVFLKGCPLNCRWCHNPESKSARPETFFSPEKCLGCGKCAAVCSTGAHRMVDGLHAFDRSPCDNCGECSAVCPSDALERSGRTASVEEVLREVMADELFYKTSGGGMTLSGGEPLLQHEFSAALLRAAKEKGLHTCMETCGFASEEVIREMIPLVDLFLFDYKLTDPALHKEYTGVSNEKILRNLALIDEAGRETVLRCPIIPTVNDTHDHFAGIAHVANRLKHIRRVELEPYHPLGSGKSEKLGKEYPLGDIRFPDDAEVQTWLEAVRAFTDVEVIKS